MTRDELVAWSKKYPWYQTHDLGDGIVIKGAFDTPRQSWLLPESMAGQRFLDLGCNTGWFVFEAERRGADAYGLDKQKDQLEKAAVLKAYYNSHATFDSGDISKLYGYPRYTLGFDVVLLTSVFHHLRKPLKALKMIRGLVRGHLVAEFCCWIPEVADQWARADVFPDDWGAAYHKAFPTEECVQRTLETLFSRVERVGPNKNAQRIVYRAYV